MDLQRWTGRMRRSPPERAGRGRFPAGLGLGDHVSAVTRQCRHLYTPTRRKHHPPNNDLAASIRPRYCRRLAEFHG